MKNLNKTLPFLIWFNQLFGLYGIFFIDFNLFLSLSPFSLIFTFLIVIYSNIEISYKSLIAINAIFLISMTSEIIGVNSGLFFGSYYYGENLGYYFYGVPLVIGLNWIVLTISCANIALYFFETNKYLSLFFGSFLMLLLDIIMEQVSGNIDFWYFNDQSLIYNYFTWFIIGLCNQYFCQKFINQKQLIISVSVYLSFILFFLTLFFFLP